MANEMLTTGEVIRRLRRERGLTQEGLAELLGVSVPAVSKWENGKSMPDITLLSPLARVLRTTPDKLLLFKEQFTKEEVDGMLKQVKECCETEGFTAGMKLLKRFMREYPASEYLKLAGANAPVMYSYTAKEEEEGCFLEIQEFCIRWLEELAAEAEDKEIRRTAQIALVSRYIMSKRYDEAEKLMDSFPPREYNAERMRATLYFLKGDSERSMKTAQKALIEDLQNIKGDILAMYTVAAKEQDYDRALVYAKEYERLGEIYAGRLGGGAEYVTAVLIKKGELAKAADYFERIPRQIEKLSEAFSESYFFDAVAEDLKQEAVSAGKVQVEDLQESLMRLALDNPEFKKLEGYPKYDACVEECRRRWNLPAE